MPPPLTTPRLHLRPPVWTDVDHIYRLGSNPRIMRFITGGKTQTREQARSDLERRMEESRGPLGYWVAQRQSDRAFLGWLALKPLEGTDRIEIGYRLLEEHWGHGYATEACRAILHYAFETLQLEEVWAVAMEENTASIQVMKKLGMTYVAEGRFYEVDCVCYKITYELFRSEDL